jgi:hypothetical protein
LKIDSDAPCPQVEALFVRNLLRVFRSDPAVIADTGPHPGRVLIPSANAGVRDAFAFASGDLTFRTVEYFRG